MSEDAIRASSIRPLWRQRPFLLIALLLLAALAWIITVRQAATMSGMDNSAGGMGAMDGMATMDAGTTSAALFLPVWVAMMVAMMFPAIAPVVALFASVGQKRRAAGNQSVPTAVFLSGYLVVWTAFGVGAYLLSLAVPSLDMMAPGIQDASTVAAGALLIFAGIYEWTPLKTVCLRHCRSPLGVFMSLWRDGWYGALRMGIVHGAYCLGCCWGLMLVLFAVGLMNITAMVLLSAVIFAEKILPRGASIGKVAGIVLVAAGLFVLSPLH